ncbi:MAG: hypothetical protein K0S27_450 [Gammaproteobacteria bacterium]|jgi:hypothetical protein|nr:hypothetical protein [Gammaproteobacteria bacterium]
MMFLIHAVFALGLISLTAGAALYIFALRNKGAGSGLGKIVGAIVMIISTFSLVCSFCLGLKIWREVYLLNMVQLHNLQIQNESTVSTPKMPPSKEHHHRK